MAAGGGPAAQASSRGTLKWEQSLGESPVGREEVQIGGCEHPGAAITSLFSLSSGDQKSRCQQGQAFFFFLMIIMIIII